MKERTHIVHFDPVLSLKALPFAPLNSLRSHSRETRMRRRELSEGDGHLSCKNVYKRDRFGCFRACDCRRGS